MTGHSDSDSGLARLLTPSGPRRGLKRFAFDQATIEYRVAEYGGPLFRCLTMALSVEMLLAERPAKDGGAGAKFILMFSCGILFFASPNSSAKYKVRFSITLLAFSFTRADMALLLSLVCAIYMMQFIAEKVLTAAIPIAVQILLVAVIYPDAEYYSDLLMVVDNISLIYFINNPTTYLLVGVVIIYWSETRDFLRNLYVEQSLVFVFLAGYVLAVFVVDRPNEYRLFLPLLPVVLLVLEKRRLGYGRGNF